MQRGLARDALSCNWNWSRVDAGKAYDYEFNYKLRVPKGINLKLSTVNEGHIEVSNVAGELQLSNVNGDVSVSGVSNNLKANTVNGVLDIAYTSMDSEFGSFSTNGTIWCFTTSSQRCFQFRNTMG